MTHYPAVAVMDARAWFVSLQDRRELTAKALELLSPCCFQSDEVRLAV
ncbi:hypothetical protein GCM10007094_28360 [Pseudovibrio japonicus]|uniref:Uncharacterized protein n=1 Tax=Pseudovibrio japonicus TaxID=366534 RepID=A0ABQ3EFG6_9HYPH|nr:hypothetical protein [Pseudovibrio japonicus]GHB37067.1 hypothetical protein GCM10007094_28360 [Pseudovibrio japonicus]